jgi:hypothetical protein
MGLLLYTVGIRQQCNASPRTAWFLQNQAVFDSTAKTGTFVEQMYLFFNLTCLHGEPAKGSGLMRGVRIPATIACGLPGNDGSLLVGGCVLSAPTITIYDDGGANIILAQFSRSRN